MKFKVQNKNTFLTSSIFLCLIFQAITLLPKKAPAGKEKDPLSDLSDADLDKLMKEYGLSNKDLGILGANNSTKPEKNKKTYDLLDLNFGDEDPLKNLLKSNNKIKNPQLNSPSALFNNNKKILEKFHISQRNAYNLVKLMKEFNLFSRLPITAKNIIAVRYPLI